jgi:hypothetical protein
MERAQPNKILPTGLLELYVVANHADNVRLLPHRFLEIAERGHELLSLLCLRSPAPASCAKSCSPVENLPQFHTIVPTFLAHSRLFPVHFVQ